MIAWSDELLALDEHQLCRSLAVLNCSRSIGARITIRREHPPDQEEAEKKKREICDRLESLVSKNLLRIRQGLDGMPRFFMLDTIQEYAQEQLEAHGELASAQKRFLQFFLDLAQMSEPHFYQPEVDTWIERLDAEDVNLRAALTWCKENSNDVYIGLQLAAALPLFWFHSGYLREGRTWLEAMLSQIPGTDKSHTRGKALYGVGLLSWKLGDVDVAAPYAEEARSIFREENDIFWGAQAELVMGVAKLAQGHVAEALLLLEECLNTFKEVKSVWGEAFTLGFLGIGNKILGNPEQTLSYYERGYQSVLQIHDLFHAPVFLSALVDEFTSQGNKEQAHFYLTEIQHRLRRSSHRWFLGLVLLNIGFNFLQNYKQYGTAKLLLQGSLSLWQDIKRLENGMGIIKGLICLAEIAAVQGQAERSGWILGAADHLTLPSGVYRDDLNERVAQIRKNLDAALVSTFEAAWVEGQNATLEQAIQKALQDWELID